MKKFLVILGTVGLTATSSMAVIACTTENLSEKSINHQLGVIEWDGTVGTAIPTDDAILEAFNKANDKKIKEKLTSDNVTISEKTRHSAIITAKKSSQGEVLKGQVEVHFERTNQNEIILNGFDSDEVVTSLGSINHSTTGDNWLLPSASDVIDGFLSVNEFLFRGGMKESVEVTNITSGSATIKALKRKGFAGEVKVTFTTKESTVNVKTKEYQFKQKTTTKEILDKVKNDNLGLKFTDLEIGVSDIKDNLGTVTITVKEGSTIYSPNQEVVIKFSIEKSNFVKTKAFDKFKDEKFEFNTTAEDVVEAFKEKYKDEKIGGELINFGQLDINANLKTQKISINVKKDSTVYNQLKKPEEVKFTVKSVKDTKLSAITISGNTVEAITGEKVLEEVNKQFKKPLQMVTDIKDIQIADAKDKAIVELNADKYGKDSKLVVEIKFDDTRNQLGELFGDELNLGEFKNTKEIETKLTEDHKLTNGQDGITIKFVENENKVTIEAQNSKNFKDGLIELTFTINDTRLILKDVFKDGLTEEFKDQEAVKSYLEAQGLINGQDGITIEFVENENKVIIKSENSEKYQDGLVDLTFTIKSEQEKPEDGSDKKESTPNGDNK